MLSYLTTLPSITAIIKLYDIYTYVEFIFLFADQWSSQLNCIMWPSDRPRSDGRGSYGDSWASPPDRRNNPNNQNQHSRTVINYGHTSTSAYPQPKQDVSNSDVGRDRRGSFDYVSPLATASKSKALDWTKSNPYRGSNEARRDAPPRRDSYRRENDSRKDNDGRKDGSYNRSGSGDDEKTKQASTASQDSVPITADGWWKSCRICNIKFITKQVSERSLICS